MSNSKKDFFAWVLKKGLLCFALLDWGCLFLHERYRTSVLLRVIKKYNCAIPFMEEQAAPIRAVRRQKKSRQKRRLVQAPQAPFKVPIHSRCCMRGFRETGLALVIVLRCDWPLCDIWFKSYEHFKIKMFLGEASYRPRTGLVQASYRPRTGAFYRRLEKRRRLRRLFSPWRLKVSTALIWMPPDESKISWGREDVVNANCNDDNMIWKQMYFPLKSS